MTKYKNRARSVKFSRREALFGGAALLGALGVPQYTVYAKSDAPYNALGELVGEVSENSAIVHTRLTDAPTRNNLGYSFPWWTHNLSREDRQHIHVPAGMPIAELNGACPGKSGLARLLYGVSLKSSETMATQWVEIGPHTDYTHQFALSNLKANAPYQYVLEIQADGGSRIRRGAAGSFRTAVNPNEFRPVKFFVITCQDYACRDSLGGFNTYESMMRLGGEFIVSTGDSVYYDIDLPLARSVELARHHWHRMYSQPSIKAAFQSMPGYWLKDDHDSFEDDDWPGRKPHRVAPMTYSDLAPVFLEQVPMGRSTYRKVRWGSALEMWLVENRDFRSPNPAPDGPRKTIWGDEQKAWLLQTLKASNARFRVLVSPDCVVGPDPAHNCAPFKFPGGNSDSQCDCGYKYEGRKFLRWVKETIGERFVVLNGDRHWQYHSVDPETGVQEFCCGAVTDSHSDVVPWIQGYHRFLRCKGGFISVSLERKLGEPLLRIRIHDVEGTVVHEAVLS